MRKTYTLHLKNFRSIRDAKIDFAPLTVVYGPNGSGKSSLIFGLLTLKNFLTNPNQNIASLFSYPTISLGGFEEVVSDHNRNSEVSLSMAVSTPDGASEFTLGVGQSGGRSALEADLRPEYEGPFTLSLDIAFPYQANQAIPYVVEHNKCSDSPEGIPVSWNGLWLLFDEQPDSSTLGPLHIPNLPAAFSRVTGFVPLKRGFTSPTYGVTNVTSVLATDAEVASLLATNRYLEYAVSDYMESIANRQIRTRMQVGTPSFNVDSIPRNGGTPVSIVNEGFGINQVVYMLTVCLYDDAKVVAIEEPEIHVHPSMIRKLVHALADIVIQKNKLIIVSTHSETFVLALLAQIAAGKVSVDDVSFIFAEKEDGESRFTKQEVTPDGQIQGGLESFITGELEDMAVFFGQNSKPVR